MIRIVFFGTPAFSVPFLRALAEADDIEVLAAVSQPDRPAGRGRALSPTPVRAAAETIGIPVIQPTSIKSEETENLLRSFGADAFVVVAYGKLIPKRVLDIPRLGCVNVHPSLLPRHRGPSPIQWAIQEGDAATGISIMLLDEGMDTGPLLACETIGIDDGETYSSLVEKIHGRGPGLLVETMQRYAAGEIVPVPQDHAKATATRLLEREDGRADWTLPMDVIERRARAYRPWPGLWTVWNRNGDDLRIHILDLVPADFRADLPPGTVSRRGGRLFVDAADGTVELRRVQPEGKSPMDASAFLAGYSDIEGARLR